MNPKQIGEISEAKVISFLLEKGLSVSIPFGNNQRYDLIIDFGDKLERAQVKTGFFKNGCISFSTCSKHGLTGKRKDYKEQIEIFLVYCPQFRDKIFRIPVDKCGTTSVLLRVDPPNGPLLNTIKWAKDYEIEAGYSSGELDSLIRNVKESSILSPATIKINKLLEDLNV